MTIENEIMKQIMAQITPLAIFLQKMAPSFSGPDGPFFMLLAGLAILMTGMMGILAFLVILEVIFILFIGIYVAIRSLVLRRRNAYKNEIQPGPQEAEK